MTKPTQETLREAVAFVIFAAGFHPDDLLNGVVKEKWDEWATDRRRAFVQADAAIATMFERLRTPSDGMIEAGAQVLRSAAASADFFLMAEELSSDVLCAAIQHLRVALTAFQQENSDDR